MKKEKINCGFFNLDNCINDITNNEMIILEAKHKKVVKLYEYQTTQTMKKAAYNVTYFNDKDIIILEKIYTLFNS